MVVFAASARWITVSSSWLPKPDQSFEPAGSAVDSAVAWSNLAGVSSFGSESDSAASLALRQLNLSRNDVTIKEVGGSPQRLAAIKSGAIAAAAMNEPALTQAREQGLYPLFDLFAAKLPWLFTGLSVDKRWLDANRPVLGRFMAATLEGAYRGLADERFAKEILAKDYKVTNPNQLPAIYIKESRRVSQSFISKDPFVPSYTGPAGSSDVLAPGLPNPLPRLHGFVRTTARPGPLVHVAIDKREKDETFPVLAYWQYGLGKVAAFTSDAAYPAKTAWDFDWAQFPR